MYEQENQRATHLLILLSNTILTMALIGESLLLGWNTGAVILLIVGLVTSWGLHLTEKIPEAIRIWLYFTLTMLSFFFYGIHETSIFDLAPMMIVIIIIFSATEIYSIIRLCVVIYLLTMSYDFVVVLGGSIEGSSLAITRIFLHLALVIMAGQLAKNVMQRQKKERKNMDGRIAELEETNRRTEDFMANVSHELRTPINAVTGITAVMLKNEEDEDKKKDILSIQMAGYRLFSQIEDILDYTEIDTGKVIVSEDTYMISSIVNDIITGNRLEQKEDMPELIFDIDAGIPSALLGDGKKIKKIVKHLIENALKFTKKGGVYVRIYALSKPYGINLCIRISDTGIGIPGEELTKIKKRFYQSNGGRNRRTGGLGLGLSIVYGMVNAMNGFIQMESTEGKGTTISVSIPQKVADEAPAMVITNRNLCLAVFLKPEKYEVPEVRNYYDEMISHMVQGLDISLHRVSSSEELERVITMYQLTHLFVGKEEYEENASHLEDLSRNTEVIVVADNSFILPSGSRVKLMKKPFYCLPIINLLNNGASDSQESFKEKRMICPGVRMLVVDDEAMNLMVAEGVFKGYEMDVTSAESGRKAIELCEREDYDLIFLDHMMPEMDGVETLKLLRKMYQDSGKVLTVIAFTANAVSGAREMFLQEGFDEFVSKPIEPMELERVLRKVLPKASISYVDKNYRKSKEAERTEQQEIRKDEEIEEQTPEKQWKEDKWTHLERGGINTNSGLQYCCNDRDFYLELLTSFARDAGRKETEINDFYQKEDYENYCILVHALKSTAKMVGADSLSENAKNAEMAAKNCDADYIREHNEELLAQYREVVQCIWEALDSGENASQQEIQEERKEISGEELIQRLEKLKEVLDTFEADKAESLISEMSGEVYQGASVGGFLCDVQKDVDDFEFASASEKVETLIKKVEGGEVG